MHRHALHSFVAALTLAGCATRAPVDMPDRFDSSGAEARVAGLSCPLCAESLTATVNQIDGVESSWLDLEAGRLTMAFGGTPPEPSQIADAIESAGFTLVGFGPAGK